MLKLDGMDNKKHPRWQAVMTFSPKRTWLLQLVVLLVVIACGLRPPALLADAPRTERDREIEELIEQLGDDDYFVRERAQAELAAQGFEAFDALMAAEQHEDIEIAARARYLIRLLQVELSEEGDSPQVKQRLADYAAQNEASRLLRIQQLAVLPNGEGLAALCRLARFETSHVLSKAAALQIINQRKIPDDAWPERGETILETLGRSPRPAADWLRVYVQAQTDRAAAVEAWSELIDQEQAALERWPDQTSNEILVGLLRYQVALLEEMDRTSEALAAMKRLIQFEDPETVDLAKLIDWLVEYRAWSLIDDVQQRFEQRLQQEPLNLYVLANARRLQGDEELAQELADQARALKPGDPGQHLHVAEALRERGMIDWAKREYQEVVDLGGPIERVWWAYVRLADFSHDAQQDLEAAELLDKGIKQLEQLPQVRAGNPKALDFIRARKHFYYSAHYRQQGDHAKEREQLEKALEHEPEDVDALIALYRLPDQTEEQRAATERLINNEVRRLRELIEADPNEPLFYNQLAWLLSNTERDLEDALRYSQRSLELKPNEAGYLDTLGRCYYHLGDYENAVKYQEQAVELDPHTQQIRRQLEQFREALENQRASEGNAP